MLDISTGQTTYTLAFVKTLLSVAAPVCGTEAGTWDQASAAR